MGESDEAKAREHGVGAEAQQLGVFGNGRNVSTNFRREMRGGIVGRDGQKGKEEEEQQQQQQRTTTLGPVSTIKTFKYNQNSLSKNPPPQQSPVKPLRAAIRVIQARAEARR